MTEMKHPSDLGTLLAHLLKERSLSMRRLSKLTGLDTATISRIVSGKQQAKPEHLRLFALHLGVPTLQLFAAAGFDVEPGPWNGSADIHASIQGIKETLQSTHLLDRQFTADLVKKELNKYEKYALTEEGEGIIRGGFAAKVESVNGVGPFIDELKQMYSQFCNEENHSERRAVLGSALLYFILSADIIPDYVFPLGYLDDAMAVQMALEKLNEIGSMD
ncbi:DUF1232 domain-containing protein [Paenibacillus thalictri]|uniref:DUF1232 domain-containing protein n=1 Tax=Paenibacillus thalictri TaxID=2527873 RepID=A0A4V2J3K6_9BACL|nr:DUF1232 domain-containing protein [Paenibacillus thalictri]TBL73067.1 DUF1232 domain-containing protein [Paenibacillus thalictri]